MTNARESFKEMRIVEFNGNKDEWPRWSKKIMSVAKIKKFSHVIDASLEVPSITENMEDDQRLIRETNKVAYYFQMFCMSDAICFNLVDTGKTENLPHGDASHIWENQLTRFESKQFGNLLTLKIFLSKTFKK